jgi:alanine dehydrogenase
MPDILLLSRGEVAAVLPSILEQIGLVESTYRAVAEGRVELPPKPGIHPRKDAFIHAMPAYLRDEDIAALKWVSGYPENASRGLPYISALIIVNDADTGQPTAVLDGAEITAARTAAASGACIRHFAPSDWETVAILGCGEQGRYHARVVNTLNVNARIRAWDPLPGRAQTLEGRVEPVEDARGALEGAEVVITGGPILEQPNPNVSKEWLGDRYLVLPLDFDANIERGVIDQAELFAVDDLGQFEYYRSAGHFADWPVPSCSVGQALAASECYRRVACVNLGIGALDAAFAAVVLGRAREQSIGVEVAL